MTAWVFVGIGALAVLMRLVVFVRAIRNGDVALRQLQFAWLALLLAALGVLVVQISGGRVAGAALFGLGILCGLAALLGRRKRQMLTQSRADV